MYHAFFYNKYKVAYNEVIMEEEKEEDKTENLEHRYDLGIRALDFLRNAGVTVAWISDHKPEKEEKEEEKEHLHLEFYAPLSFNSSSPDRYISYEPCTMWYNCLNFKSRTMESGKGRKSSVCEFVDFLVNPDNFYLIDDYYTQFWKKLQPLMEARSLSELELKLAILGF